MIDRNDRLKQETEALIEAIWGPAVAENPAPLDPATRTEQNRALAAAMREYLQQYLQEL